MSIFIQLKIRVSFNASKNIIIQREKKTFRECIEDYYLFLKNLRRY